jgi:hypothetical protein
VWDFLFMKEPVFPADHISIEDFWIDLPELLDQFFNEKVPQWFERPEALAAIDRLRDDEWWFSKSARCKGVWLRIPISRKDKAVSYIKSQETFSVLYFPQTYSFFHDDGRLLACCASKMDAILWLHGKSSQLLCEIEMESLEKESLRASHRRSPTRI